MLWYYILTILIIVMVIFILIIDIWWFRDILTNILKPFNNSKEVVIPQRVEEIEIEEKRIYSLNFICWLRLFDVRYKLNQDKEDSSKYYATVEDTDTNIENFYKAKKKFYENTELLEYLNAYSDVRREINRLREEQKEKRICCLSVFLKLKTDTSNI